MDHTMSREAGTCLIHLCISNPVNGIEQPLNNCLVGKKKIYRPRFYTKAVQLSIYNQALQGEKKDFEL